MSNQASSSSGSKKTRQPSSKKLAQLEKEKRKEDELLSCLNMVPTFEADEILTQNSAEFDYSNMKFGDKYSIRAWVTDLLDSHIENELFENLVEKSIVCQCLGVIFKRERSRFSGASFGSTRSFAFFFELCL